MWEACGLVEPCLQELTIWLSFIMLDHVIPVVWYNMFYISETFAWLRSYILM